MLVKYKGKVVYIDLWATWCAPCIDAMKSSQKLKAQLKDRDIVFLYLCMSSPNQAGWKNIIAAKKLEGENYFLDQEQSSIISKMLNISGILHHALIGKNGNIVDTKASSPSERKNPHKNRISIGKLI